MTSRRLTVQEAAEALGTSVDAVRMRARRGSLESEKEPDGRVYVWVDGDSSETKPRLDGEFSTLKSAEDELVEGLRDQVLYLRVQLDGERESRRRADTIIAQLTQATAEQARTIRELEAPASPEEVPNGCEAAEWGTASESPQEPSSSRSWWRRLLGT